MAADHDLVIRGGAIADGGGGPLIEGDLAIRDGRIIEVGVVAGRGREEIDARGKLVTPGFVDIHTHYDGQVTWGERLTPSSMHGVTTALMGNCGVGFGPCKPEDRAALIRVMEGVEDIPEVVMAEGLPWRWRTFPDYMDFLDSRQADIDFAVQIPHAPMRVFVMGERGVNLEPANEADLAKLTGLVAEGIAAGALGVSTSRNPNHRTVAGDLAPMVVKEQAELLALAEGLRQANAGVFQLNPTLETAVAPELDLMRAIVETARRPLSFSLLRKKVYEDEFDKIMAWVEQTNADGHRVMAQVYPRPNGIWMGLELSLHPFRYRPTYKKIHHLPLGERVAAMRDPAVRAAILSEKPEHENPAFVRLTSFIDGLFELGDPPNYKPGAQDTMAARAARRGVSPAEEAYDELLEDGGRRLLFWAVHNYMGYSLEPLAPLIDHPNTVIALGDGGAHYGLICDASYPTSVLTDWTRDRPQASRLDLGVAVRRLSRDTARAVGLGDRGLLAPGLRADVNVIDYDRLSLRAPRMVGGDMPAGGRRLMQEAEGYSATVVAGAVTYRDGAPTGALPGRFVRGARAAPQANN
jgi:N-acyl-D-aspartate/D-glutamate deacylase